MDETHPMVANSVFADPIVIAEIPKKKVRTKSMSVKANYKLTYLLYDFVIFFFRSNDL